MSKFNVKDEVIIHTSELSNKMKEEYNNQIGAIVAIDDDNDNKYKYTIKMDNNNLNRESDNSGWLWSDEELELSKELKVEDRIMVILESKGFTDRNKYVGHTGIIKKIRNGFSIESNKLYTIIFDDKQLEEENLQDGVWYWEFEELLKLKNKNFVR